MSGTLFPFENAIPKSKPANSIELPPSLLDIVTAWHQLPPHVQESIHALAEIRKQPCLAHNVESLPLSRDTLQATLEQLDQLRRLLLRALRHKPQLIEAEMDCDGWVDCESVLRWFESHLACSRTIGLARLVADFGDRVQLRHDKIRASYGHSCVAYNPNSKAIPNLPLFHGTASKNWAMIEMFGLVPGHRRFVQLTSDFDYAFQIASSREDSHVVVQVCSGPAMKDGVEFFETGTHVWLATPVPAIHLQPWQSGNPIARLPNGMDFDRDSLT